MKKFKNVVLVATSIALISIACNKSTDTTSSTPTVGNWIKRTVFGGNDVAGAATFTIGDTVYVIGGYDGIARTDEMWAFAGNGWKQSVSLPGTKRNLAAAFTIGTKGYIVGGACDANLSPNGRLSDVWEYNPAKGEWLQKTSLTDLNATVGSGARYDAVGFGMGSKGYITCGYTGRAQNDMWEFDPTGNGGNGSWTQKTSMPSTDRRQGAIVLVNGDSATIVGGISNGTLSNEVFTYKPATDTWTPKRNITNTSTDTYDDLYTTITRANGVGFVLNGKGYISTGSVVGYNNTTWEYDFTADTWTQLTNYERAERSNAIGFTLKGKAYVGLGKNTTYYYGNLDEFVPTMTYDAND